MMTSQKNEALANIAGDALTLRQDLRKSAQRCHKVAAAGSPEHEVLADELREYVGIAKRLAVAVSVYLPGVSKTLQVLSRGCDRIASPVFTAWDGLDADLRAVEDAALGAIHCKPPDDYYVTLLQMAAVVGGTSKRTIRRLYDEGELPPPDIPAAKRGLAHQWRWAVVRPILEERFSRSLPETFPADRYVRS